jgi:ribonucleoside-triphosphate reductase (thioredoxin)
VKLDRDFVESYRSTKVPWGFNGLGEIVYKRTYSRVKEDGNQEEWVDTLERVVNGTQEIGAAYTQEEMQKLFDHMFHLRCLLGGRYLWQLGTETVRRFGATSLLNCAFVAIRKPKDFLFVFDHLLLGSGVGYSVRRSDINELPRIKSATITHEKTKDADFIVPDKREGWTQLLEKVLHAFFVTGKSFTYSTILVRGYGEPIKGFGGKASGALPLIEGIEKISTICNARAGKKLRSVDVLDIANILGSIVVSGNVRRSAEIALGDSDDVLFLRAKNWSMGNIPNHRAMSNNTVYADSFDYLTEELWSGYSGSGEPYGLFNLALSQTQGRLGEYVQDNCEGTNPCGEISLDSYEMCNLSEFFLPNIESREQLQEIVTLLYKTQKAVTAMKHLYAETDQVVHKNRRIGIAAGGIVESLHKLEWLDDTYRYLRAFDRVWSAERGWPTSIKLTTEKPSGTISLLAGVTPGIHPAYAQYYIRRVRIASNDPLIEYCRNAGYSIEFARGFDGRDDPLTSIVSFPCKSSDHAILAKDMTAVHQLELVKQLQTVWSDNAVSCTVYYRLEELDQIKQWLKENYETSIKSVSFLLHSDHGFHQAPYEEIDLITYTLMTNQIRQATYTNISGDVLDVECINGTCPVR